MKISFSSVLLKMNRRVNYDQVLLFLVLGLGIALCINQFLYNRNIWGDEAYVAYRLVTRNFAELMNTSGDLVLPMLFLFIQKSLTLLLPNTETALKILPFISYFGALWFLIRLIKIISPKNLILVAAVALFVFNLITIRYATEIKQYMTDVFFAVAMFYFTLKSYEHFNNKILFLSLVGVIGIFLTHISVIILATSGVILIRRSYLGISENNKYLFIIFAVWLSFFAFNYFAFLNNAISYEPAIKHWIGKKGFMPIDLFSEEATNFFLFQYNQIFNNLFYFGKTGFYILPMLMILGIIHLIRKRNYDLLLLAFVPLIIHLLLSALQIYPIAVRLILYMMPGFILVIVSGLELIAEMIKHQRYSLYHQAITFIFVVTLLGSFPLSYYPFRNNNVKVSINYILENHIVGDTIVVERRVGDIYRFYHVTEPDLAPLPFIWINLNFFKHEEGYLRNLKNQTGRKWLLHTKMTPRFQRRLKSQIEKSSGIILEEYISWGSAAYLVEFGKSYEN